MTDRPLREVIAEIILPLFEDERTEAHCAVVQSGGTQDHARNAGNKAQRDAAEFYVSEILAALPQTEGSVARIPWDAPMSPAEQALAQEIYDAWSASALAETAIERRAKIAAKVALALPQTGGSEVREALERLIEHAQNMEHAMHPQEYMEHGPSQVVDAARQALALPVDGWRPFQERVGDWMQKCFTPEIAADRLERNDRFIEEALELVQSTGYCRERAHALVDYVFDREVGEPIQELGGVMVTLAALCNPNRLDMTACAERELERISQPEIVEKIRAKQKTKPAGSALPVPAPPDRKSTGMHDEYGREIFEGDWVQFNVCFFDGNFKNEPISGKIVYVPELMSFQLVNVQSDYWREYTGGDDSTYQPFSELNFTEADFRVIDPPPAPPAPDSGGEDEHN
jgi:hypothetical protein